MKIGRYEIDTYALLRPGRVLRVKAHQFLVKSFLVSQPESVADRADFVQMPFDEAYLAILRAKMQQESQKPTRGIQFSDWTEDDQKLLKQGKSPKGAPHHRNF